MYQRDFSKFDNNLFRDDVSIQNWDAILDKFNDIGSLKVVLKDMHQ